MLKHTLKPYNSPCFADISIVSAIGICLTVAIVIAIFPLLSAVYVSVDKNDKSFKLTFSLFGITLFKYNAVISAFGFKVKKTFKKPYSREWADVIKKPQAMGAIKLSRISVLSIETIADIGLNETSALMLVSAANVAKTAIYGIIQALKPNVKIADDLNVYYNSAALRVFLRVKTVFNILDLFSIFILHLWENFNYAIGKQNKQRSGKRA